MNESYIVIQWCPLSLDTHLFESQYHYYQGKEGIVKA